MINDCLSFHFIIFFTFATKWFSLFFVISSSWFYSGKCFAYLPVKITLPPLKTDTLVSKVLPTFKCFLSGFLLFPNFQAFRELKNENACA